LRVECSDRLIFMTCRTIEERFWLHPLLTCAASPPNRKAKRAMKALDGRFDKRYERLAKKANERRGKHCDTAAAGRVTYAVTNPRKAKLVVDPESWPGLNLAFGLGDTDAIAFEYLDLETWYRKGRPENIDGFFTTATLKLSPLPELADLDRNAYARIVRKWAAEAANDADRDDDAKQVHGGSVKRQVLGVQQVQRCPVHTQGRGNRQGPKGSMGGAAGLNEGR
jgi:hypothetical protein